MDIWENNGILLENGRFQVRVAVNDADIKAAKELRTQVLGNELPVEFGDKAKLDMDTVERQFHHLLVVDTEAGKTAGTYCFQAGWEAVFRGRFLASFEYMIDGLEAITDDVCEVSHACVAEEYRNGAVITLLWAGLAELQRRMGFRYMMGCVAISDRNPGRVWALYGNLCRRRQLSDVIFGRARAAFWLQHPVQAMQKVYEPNEPLFKGYLRLGAKVAGEPAWNRRNHAIDMLFLLDFQHVDEKYARHFELAVPPQAEADGSQEK